VHAEGIDPGETRRDPMSKTPYQQFVERNGGGPAFKEPGSITVLTTWNVENMQQMMVALSEAMEDAKNLGHHPSTVYPNKLRLALVEEALSDGSTVVNLYFHDGARDRFTALGRKDESDG
jgi:hypothetical protein